jgi:DNA-binding CsgD family transcriptional regulator
VQGRPEDATLGAVLRRRMDIDAGWAVASVTESGPVRPVDPELADAAADLLLAWNRSRHRVGAAPLRVAVVHHRHGVRLLAHQQRADPPAEGGWWPPVPTVLAGAEVRFDEVPGWGLALRADLPYAASGLVPDPTPLTPREQQVLHLIRLGRTDREIAARLVLSPKTVEKHVGALLRKTGARSRAAAVATALERGWLGPTGAAVGDSPHTEGPAARLH